MRLFSTLPLFIVVRGVSDGTFVLLDTQCAHPFLLPSDNPSSLPSSTHFFSPSPLSLLPVSSHLTSFFSLPPSFPSPSLLPLPSTPLSPSPTSPPSLPPHAGNFKVTGTPWSHTARITEVPLYSCFLHKNSVSTVTTHHTDHHQC